MKLSEYKFVKIINELKAVRELQENIDELMSKAKDNINHDFMNAASLMINHEDIVVELLEDIMDDDGGWISWWIYDCDFGENHTEIYNNNDEVMADIKTAEDLYNYLIELCEE